MLTPAPVPRPASPSTWRTWVRRALAVGTVVAAGAGCSRQHFRDRADKDVAGVITQKNIFPDWKVENWHVYPDGRARFADPSCPDHPPYPPDDPAAWMLSPNPQKPHKKWGSSRYEGTEYLKIIADWDAANRAEDGPDADPSAQQPAAPGPAGGTAGATPAGPPPKGNANAKDNPAAKLPEAYTAVTGGVAAGTLTALRSDERAFRLRLEQAVELGLFNSREFQDRREDLYLSALPVTTERFAFAAQALAATNALYEALGRDRPGGPANRWTVNTTSSVSRLFPAGGQLLFSFANQVVVDFSRGRPDIAVSNMSLTFIQPLLRGGGYAVTLEPLTQAERNLLYAIRSYARFRKIFYVAVVAAGDYTNNPYGLQGLSVNLGRGIGNNLTAPTAGYLPITLQIANVNNQRKNIAALEQLVRLYQNLKEGGVVSDLQSVRVELQLLQSQSTLLTQNRQYLDNLDIFKLQLGVPTNLPLELDDTPVRPIRKQLDRFDKLYAELDAFQAEIGKFNPNETTAQVRDRLRRLLTESSLARGTSFAKEYPESAARLASLTPDELTRQVNDLLARRQRLLDQRAERQLAGRPETEAESNAIDAVEAGIDRVRFEQAVRAYDQRPWLKAPPDRRFGEQLNAYRGVVDAGLLVALQARNQRLDNIRADWPVLPAATVDGADVLRVPLDEGYTRVAQTALVNRLDLMNARGQVVDAYRQIAVQANSLLGRFDVRYDYNTNSPDGENTPFALGGSRARNAVTLNLQLPTVRRVERNNYRAALISYQRQRRTLMAFEDNILNDVRAGLRQLRQLAEQYNVQKRAVELAYAQVDNARATLLAPPDPQAGNGGASGPAALTEQLLQAQNQLLTAQNAVYQAWVNYLTTRMNLYLDLELLPLDARGVWTDEPACASPPLPPEPAPGGPPADGVAPERLPAPRPADPGR
jgi:hypothetical protein